MMSKVVKRGSPVTHDQIDKAAFSSERETIVAMGDDVRCDEIVRGSDAYGIAVALDPHTHVEMPLAGVIADEASALYPQTIPSDT